MKALSLVSVLLALIAWALFISMGVNLLSGDLSERSCDTACVQLLFFSAIAVAVIAVIVSGISMKNGFNVLNIPALLAALGICGIAGFLFIAGNAF